MEYNFDVEKHAKAVIEWIKKWISENGNESTKVVIGVSGGKDSTVTSKLLCEALGKDRVIGVMMPNGTQADISDSQMLCNLLGIEHYTINIAEGYKGLTSEIQSKFNDEKYSYNVYKTNTPARLRMTTLFGIAAIVGNAMVVNTCNLSEDVMGYSTFYGDSAGCFSPLCKLTTEEVVAIGDYLGLPQNLTHKAPSDGMCGKTDEDNLGWTYHEVNETVRKGIKGPHYDAIVKRWNRMKYKIDIICLPSYNPELPFCL